LLPPIMHLRRYVKKPSRSPHHHHDERGCVGTKA
jgi:hypothetical protein